jgi:hypothetical protein
MVAGFAVADSILAGHKFLSLSLSPQPQPSASASALSLIPNSEPPAQGSDVIQVRAIQVRAIQ